MALALVLAVLVAPAHPAPHARAAEVARNADRIPLVWHRRNVRHAAQVRRDRAAARAARAADRRAAAATIPAAPAVVPTPRPSVSSTGCTGSTNPYVSDPCGCEGQPTTNTGNGYGGKYQFDVTTWNYYAPKAGAPTVADTAGIAAQPESVQDAVAALVTYDAWPNC